MTQAEYENSIRNNQSLIGQYNRQIEVLRQEIAKIQSTQGEITSIREQFSQYQSESLKKISDNGDAMAVNEHIARAISKKLGGVFHDLEHSNMTTNLGNSVSQGDREIQSRRAKIENLQAQIQACSASIRSSSATLQQLQAEENT